MHTKIAFSYNHPLLTVTHRITEAPSQDAFPMNVHGSFEIVLCKSGRVSYMVGGLVYPLPPDTLIAIAPGVPHRILIEGAANYDRFSAIIRPGLLPKNAAARLRRSCIRLSLRAGDPIGQLFARAEDYAKGLPTEAHRPLFHALAVELFYRLLAKDNEDIESAPEGGGSIDRALAYIDAHLTEIKSVSEISRALYLSTNYFHTLFRKHLGMTPLAYLTERRLALAHVRICEGEKPTALYKDCGFLEYSTFYRAYKKRYGCSPRTPCAPAALGDEELLSF